MWIFLTTLFSAMLPSLLATILFESGRAVYQYLQANKSFDDKLKDAFDRAVDKYFCDELQQEKVKFHNHQEYIEKFRRELQGESDVFESEKYKNLYKYFKREVYATPTLWADCLFAYFRIGREEIKKSTEEIKSLINKRANELAAQYQQIQDMLGRFVQCAALPSFSIHNATEATQLPNHISKRTVLVSALRGSLNSHRFMIIYGTELSGKSVLAQLVAESYNAYYIDCRQASGLRDIRFSLLNYKTSFLSHELIVLDNLPYETLEDVLSELEKEDTSVKYLITTIEKFDPSFASCRVSNLYQVEIPFLTDEEITEIVASYNPNFNIQEIVGLCSRQHPLLVHAVCEYMQSKNWHVDMAVLSDLFRGVSHNSLRDFVGKRILNEIRDSETRHLLNRLLLVTTTFTDEDVLKLAEIEPQISQPQSRLLQIKPSWLMQNREGGYAITPVLKSAWSPDLLKSEQLACNKYLGESILAKKDLTELEAVLAITYFLNAGMADYAGHIYVEIIGKYGSQLSAQSLLSNMWVGTALPIDMSVGMRYVIRLTQWSQLKSLSEISKKQIYDDLMYIIRDEGDQMYNAPLAYKTVSSMCLINGDVTNAQYCIKKSREAGPIEGGEDAKEFVGILTGYNQLGLWRVLAEIDTLPKFEEWLLTYDEFRQSESPFREMEYAFCRFFIIMFIDVKNAALSITEKTELLDQFLAKAQAHKVETLVIMLVHKKMVINIASQEYEKVEELYSRYMPDYETNPLAIYMFNDAMGAALYENKKIENKEQCLSYFDKANSLNDKLIIPEMQLHTMERIALIHAVTDMSIALDSFLKAYEYAQKPEHYIDMNELYFIRGEMVQIKWSMGYQEGATHDLSECMGYAIKEVETDSICAKTYLCRCGILIERYISDITGEVDEKQVQPTLGIFLQLNYSEYDEIYSERRRIACAIKMYMLSDMLGVEDIKKIWAYKSVELCKKKNDVQSEYALMQGMYPYFLTKGDLANALYVSTITSKAWKKAKKEYKKEFNHTIWVLENLVVPMLLQALTKIIKENDSSLYNQLANLLNQEEVDASNQMIKEAKGIFEKNIEEIDSSVFSIYPKSNKYPLNFIAHIILLMRSDVDVLKVFTVICQLLQTVLPRLQVLYRNSADGIFDDFVITYWQWLMETKPGAFCELEFFRQRGMDVSGFKEKKAHKFMSRLRHHVRNLNPSTDLSDWLYEA